jgi:hypothetical protein
LAGKRLAQHISQFFYVKIYKIQETNSVQFSCFIGGKYSVIGYGKLKL